MYIYNLDIIAPNPLFDEAKRVFNSGRCLEALELFKAAHEQNNTLYSMVHLAYVHRYLRHFEEARILWERAMDSQLRTIGEFHLDTLSSMANLAVTYKAMKRYEQAGELQERVIGLLSSVLGAEHPHTIDIMSDLAYTYIDLEQYDKAVALGEDVLDLCRRVPGSDYHPPTQESIDFLEYAMRFRRWAGKNKKV